MSLPRPTLAALVLALAVWTAPKSVYCGDFLISDAYNFALSVSGSEIVDLTRGDRLLYVSKPGVHCAGEGEPSALVGLLHAPGSANELQEFVSLDIGLGEVTSVSAHPLAAFSLLTVKDPDKPDVLPGRIIAVAGNSIIREVATGAGPDSVAISPDGLFAVVACEAQTPVPADCANQAVEEDVAGGIDVLDLRPGRRFLSLLARITADELHSRFFAAHPSRAAYARAIEPEFAFVGPGSEYALVSLQEQSAVAVIDLKTVIELRLAGLRDVEALGAAALRDVVFLPHGFLDAAGRVRGTHPDGLAIDQKGQFAITANETNSNVRHLASISILDLRGGLDAIAVVATHCVFDLDPTLLGGTGLTTCPRVAPGDPFPPEAADLPRLDPEDTTILRRNRRIIVAVALERPAKDQDRGSVLFLDATGAVDGVTPVKIDRKLAGINPGARPESVDGTHDGRHVFAALENDGGTLARFEIGIED
jgi:DNA-binding beta-propeller fold protein YncE